MTRHPLSVALERRFGAMRNEVGSRFAGNVFRFVRPAYSKTTDLFAGKGALYANGRWLLQGVAPAAYTSLEPETALAESFAAARYFGFPLSTTTPIVLVSAKVRLSRVIDLSDGLIRRRVRVSSETMLRCDWRADNRGGSEAITQAIGRVVQSVGFEAMLVPSAARAGGANLIVFPRNLANGSSLDVVKEVEWPIG